MWPGFRENDQPCSKFIGGTRRELRLSLAHPLDHLSREQFVRAWSAVAYVFPGLHPDGCENVESGWPRALKRFAAEAWRRGDAGELADEELQNGNRTLTPALSPVEAEREKRNCRAC